MSNSGEGHTAAGARTAFRTPRRGHMPKATPRAPAEQVALYDKLVATDSRAERKGATMPYTSVNGNMFSLLGPEGLILRLSPADREAFVAKHKTKPVVMYGAEMREYVAVPATLLAK